nr:MAG TPA: hypothetical protein [Caudoviricetes sp.]
MNLIQSPPVTIFGNLCYYNITKYGNCQWCIGNIFT